MFVSPCTLRSTQCAALIALATVAGIARVEANPQPNTPASPRESPTHAEADTRSAQPRFLVAPTWSAPWLHPFAKLAWWLLAANDRSIPDLTAANASAPDQAPVAPVCHRAPISPHLTAPDGGSVADRSEPRIARGSRSHLVPFAVGPPQSPRTPNLRANGTPVPTVDFARRLLAVPVAHVSFRLVARLACRRFSRHPWVGLVSFPSFALRGVPGSLPAPNCFRPPLGVDAARGGRPFPL
jgi:hypothetical protein